MFSVVRLEKTLKNVVVPIQWIHSIDLSNLIKTGVNLSQKHVIFYSNQKEEANFTLEVDVIPFIEENSRGCFYGTIIQFFGMYFFLSFVSVYSFKYIIILNSLIIRSGGRRGRILP